MTKHKYQHRLQAEVIKHLERQAPLTGAAAVEAQLGREDGDLEGKILTRSRLLSRDNELQEPIHKIRKWARLSILALCLGFFMLGGLAAEHAFDQLRNGVVNFYWLIIVLLGFNLMALIFWLTALVLSYARSGWLNASPGLWIKRLLTRLLVGKGQEATIAKAIYLTQWNGHIGRWSLSRLSHSLWLSYLCGGFLMILLMLSTRQFDFVWATTILSEQTFVELTESLGRLPAEIGFSVPTPDQIAGSRLQQASSGQDVYLRQSWAALLIGSMLIYGLVPRLLLLVLSHLMFLRACSLYRLDLTDPYYVSLRSRLMPATRQFGVVDPDLVGRNDRQLNGGVIKSDQKLPEQALYVGLELNPDQDWPPAGVAQDHNLGKAVDRQSQREVLERLKASKIRDLVAVVSLQRSPDRGLERYLDALQQQCRGLMYLAIGQAETAQAESEPEISERASDWYQLAARVGIPTDRIIHLRYTPSSAGRSFIDMESVSQQARNV